MVKKKMMVTWVLFVPVEVEMHKRKSLELFRKELDETWWIIECREVMRREETRRIFKLLEWQMTWRKGTRSKCIGKILKHHAKHIEVGLGLSGFSEMTEFNLGLPQWLPSWLSGKESACQCKRGSLISGLAMSPGRRNGNPVQYSCLGNPWTKDPGRLQSMGSQKSWTQLSK